MKILCVFCKWIKYKMTRIIHVIVRDIFVSCLEDTWKVKDNRKMNLKRTVHK